MRRFVSRRLAAALAAGAFILAPAALSAADFPDPSNNAALYDAAKKEGELTWYTSFSPETEKVISSAFAKRYPGITVKTQLLVGLAQYQRFVLETEAKQYIADMLQIADRPGMQDLIQRKFVAPWRVPTVDRYDDAVKAATTAAQGDTGSGWVNPYSPTAAAAAGTGRRRGVPARDAAPPHRGTWRLRARRAAPRAPQSRAGPTAGPR